MSEVIALFYRETYDNDPSARWMCLAWVGLVCLVGAVAILERRRLKAGASWTVPAAVALPSYAVIPLVAAGFVRESPPAVFLATVLYVVACIILAPGIVGVERGTAWVWRRIARSNTSGSAR